MLEPCVFTDPSVLGILAQLRQRVRLKVLAAREHDLGAYAEAGESACTPRYTHSPQHARFVVWCRALHKEPGAPGVPSPVQRSSPPKKKKKKNAEVGSTAAARGRLRTG